MQAHLQSITRSLENEGSGYLVEKSKEWPWREPVRAFLSCDEQELTFRYSLEGTGDPRA